MLIAVAARLAIGPGVRRPAYYMLGGSLLTLLIADVVYAFSLLSETYHTGYPGDAFWLLSYLLFGAAALHPSMSALTEPEPEQEIKFTRRRLALLAAASLTTPAVRGIQAFRGQETEVYITVGGSVVLFLLVLMRLAGLVRQLSGTLERTRLAEADRRRTEERFTSLVQSPRSSRVKRSRRCCMRTTGPGSSRSIARWSSMRPRSPRDSSTAGAIATAASATSRSPSATSCVMRASEASCSTLAT